MPFIAKHNIVNSNPVSAFVSRGVRIFQQILGERKDTNTHRKTTS